MWNKLIKNLEIKTDLFDTDEFNKSVKNEDEFLSVLDPSLREDDNSEPLFFRRLLHVSNNDNPDNVQQENCVGELNIFKTSPQNAINIYTQLTLSLNNLLKTSLNCDVFNIAKLPPNFYFESESNTQLSEQWHCCLLRNKKDMLGKAQDITDELSEYIYTTSPIKRLIFQDFTDEIKEKILVNIIFIFILNNKEFQALELTKIFKEDSVLSVALLKHVNKVFSGTSVQAESVDHAITLLGQERFLLWLAANALLNSGSLIGQQNRFLLVLRQASLLINLIDTSNNSKITPKDIFLAAVYPLLNGLFDLDKADFFQSLQTHAEQKLDLTLDIINFELLNKFFSDYALLLDNFDNCDEIQLKNSLNKLGISEKSFKEAIWKAVKWEAEL
ncbi:HDOD domain-containing protein [Desulfovibrio litoralis]|uniref:HDOD domain-containing protein n=1 Tax=Desulfovibrio litoralis DSM 11393 TaxID=1121455 RepID=A0A1M7SX80_9BACT|nr:HDOD domain-containing protein [Desulfovibrio litoralis]SHN63115.1 HDOD domain-containing protein [Desulfovibrio litoralis DSM 11393]